MGKIIEFMNNNLMNFKRPEICILIGIGVASSILTSLIGGLFAILICVVLITLFGDRVTHSIMDYVRNYYGDEILNENRDDE